MSTDYTAAEMVALAEKGLKLDAAEAEIERLKADLDNARSEGYEEGYSEGQGDCEAALQDFWRSMLNHLKKHDCEPACDDGYSHNASQMMDAVFEREGNLQRHIERLKSELKTVLDRETATTARLEAKIEFAQWTTDVAKALIEAHFSLCYRYQDFIVGAPPTRDARAQWRVWHLDPSVRAQMTAADAALYDALMKTRGSTEQNNA